MIANDASTPSSPDELTLPADTHTLDDRALEIASTPFCDHVARTELAAICHLRAHGSVAFADVAALAARSRHLHAALAHDPSQDWIQEPVFGVGRTVWGNLVQLVAGETVTFEAAPEPADPDRVLMSDHDAYVAWTERQRERAVVWFQTVMADLEQIMRSETLYSFEAADHVPSELVREFGSRFARQYFDGLYGVGASLECQPSSSASGVSGPTSEGGVYLADALARATLRTMTELDEAEAQGNADEHHLLGQQLMLWWGLLKGYTWSAAHANEGQVLAAMLGKHSAVTARICEALEQGLAALGRHNVPTGSAWRSGHTEWSERIAETPTSDVIAKLQTAIAEWEEFTRQLRAMR